MKKSAFLLVSVLMVSMLTACAGSSTADHNGKSCPKGTQDKTACNRTIVGH